MPVELEAKMKVADANSVRQRVIDAGGKVLGEFAELNVFFDTEDRLLLAADKGLRIRKNRDVKNGTDSIIITFKGPRHPGPLKSREETELEVQDLDDARHLLEAMGYQKVLSFEKRRESWLLDKCRIELDEVPHLGSFVEIEGPREQIVMTLRQKLGLSAEPIIKSSYTALLMTWLQDRGEQGREVVFPDSATKSPR